MVTDASIEVGEGASALSSCYLDILTEITIKKGEGFQPCTIAERAPVHPHSQQSKSKYILREHSK